MSRSTDDIMFPSNSSVIKLSDHIWVFMSWYKSDQVKQTYDVVSYRSQDCNDIETFWYRQLSYRDENNDLQLDWKTFSALTFLHQTDVNQSVIWVIRVVQPGLCMQPLTSTSTSTCWKMLIFTECRWCLMPPAALSAPADNVLLLHHHLPLDFIYFSHVSTTTQFAGSPHANKHGVPVSSWSLQTTDSLWSVSEASVDFILRFCSSLRSGPPTGAGFKAVMERTELIPEQLSCFPASPMMMVHALSSPISFFRVTLSGICCFFFFVSCREQMLLLPFCPSMSACPGPVRSVQSSVSSQSQ